MMEVPGYRIVRALGRGGMATVYLAIQESVQREVALKVMSPTLHGDSEFGERFLREAQIAASLRHRHVVLVHDVGRAGDLHYMAMEYLSGGSVMSRTLGKRDLAFCLRVAREMALALDYAHRRGVIHRDIKPDNILLRDDEAAVLSDFGIARAQDSKRMTMTGTILGTPHYMAPEQASGAPVDGRADLYSLGVVFHELAVGVVPYDAADWVSVGLMHLQAPIPRLPPALARLQPLIDTMLAKNPDERLQTGAELAEVISEFEQALAGPSLAVRTARAALAGGEPGPPIRPSSQAPAVPNLQQDTRRREPALTADADEPALGEMNAALDAPSPRSRKRGSVETPTSHSKPWVWVVALLVALILLGYSQREVLRDMLPQSRNEALLEQAEEALRAQRLVGKQPAGARELFQAVLALDPDNTRAHIGLAAVASGLLDQAREAIAKDEVDVARQLLMLARDADAPAREIEPLETAIRDLAQSDDRLAELVQRAQAALAAGRIDVGDDSALALYTQALQIEPGSSVAQVGRREAHGLMLERTRGLIESKNFAAAGALIEQVASADPGHLGLPEARGRLAQAQQALTADTVLWLQQAEALRKQGRLTAPAGNSARDRYRAVLEREPANDAAKLGLRQIAAALVQQANRLMADYEFERATNLLDEAAATDSTIPDLRAARTRLRDLQQSRGGLASGVLTEAQQASVTASLTAAAQARAEGNLMYPPGESAWDLYRRVLSLDPNNAAAKQGMAELPAATRQLFEQALGSSRLSAARGYLEGLQTLAPSDVALPDMRRRLAAALVGYATERLGAGEVDRARGALDQAQEVDPNNPDIARLRARIDQARD